MKKLGRPKLHEYWGTRTYVTWFQMKQRCQDKNCTSYPRYGARGITVCERWQNFLPFLEDMGERPLGMSIDRIDNMKGYEPSNCRWATTHEQAVNRSTTRLITFNGETLCMAEWARRLGVRINALIWRLERWDLKRALTEPPSKGRSNGRMV